MSTIDIATIETRLVALPEGPWVAYSVEGPLRLASGEETTLKCHSVCRDAHGKPHLCVATSVGVSEAEARAIAEFVANAPDDIRDLIARNRELDLMDQAASAWVGDDGLPNTDRLSRVRDDVIRPDLERLGFERHKKIEAWHLPGGEYWWHWGAVKPAVLLQEGADLRGTEIAKCAKNIGRVEGISPIRVIARWFAQMGGAL